jgi:hypothetical protein
VNRIKITRQSYRKLIELFKMLSHSKFHYLFIIYLFLPMFFLWFMLHCIVHFDLFLTSHFVISTLLFTLNAPLMLFSYLFLCFFLLLFFWWFFLIIKELNWGRNQNKCFVASRSEENILCRILAWELYPVLVCPSCICTLYFLDGSLKK